MKKTLSLCSAIIILILILQLSISPIANAFSFANLFRIGISGKVIDSTLLNKTEAFNMTVSYAGYKNYTDYTWNLVKTERASGQNSFNWQINDFADAIKIKSSSPVFISQSTAILAFKQVPIGSCLRCNEVSVILTNREFAKRVSAIIKGNAKIEVYFGTNAIVKRKFVQNLLYSPEKINGNKQNIGKLSNFIDTEKISSLDNAKYTVYTDNSAIKLYFNDTLTSVTTNIDSMIIAEKLG